MNTQTILVPVALLSLFLTACSGARYRLPDALEGQALVPIAAEDAGEGAWRRKGMFWAFGTHKTFEATFKLQHEDGREAKGRCRRFLTDPEQSRWTARSWDFTVECVAKREDGAELGRVAVWWVDQVEQQGEAIALGEVLALRSGGDSFWRLPGGVAGYDIAHEGEVIGVLAYVGEPGLRLREQTPPRVKSASHLTALLLGAAYNTSRAAERGDDGIQIDLTAL